MLLPHILSDTLFNKTGFEGEEVVYHVQQMLAKDELSEELINLIIREAYAVEQGKEKSYKAFEEQMRAMESMMGPQGGMPGMPGQPGMLPGMPGQPPMPGMPLPVEQPPKDGALEKVTDGAPAKTPEDEAYLKFMELMQNSKHDNPMEDPAIKELMQANMPPMPEDEMAMQQAMNPQMFDMAFMEKAKTKEEEFIAALPKEYVEKIEKEREQILKMNAEFEQQYRQKQAAAIGKK